MIDATCEHCGGSFPLQGAPVRFCSAKCRQENRASAPKVEKACAQCSASFLANPPGHGRVQRFCSVPCSRQFFRDKEKAERVCTVCGQTWRTRRADAKFCSDKCRSVDYKDRYTGAQAGSRFGSGVCVLPPTHPVVWINATTSLVYGECAQCGRATCSPSSRPRSYCGDLCRRRASDHRKAARHGEFVVSDALRLSVYEADDWTCHLCGTPTSRTYSHHDLLSPTLDHVIPRSQGGSDDVDNLRLAHLICNSTRNDRADVLRLPPPVTAPAPSC